MTDYVTSSVGKLVDYEPIKSVLKIGGSLHFHLPTPRPNIWWRLWQWVIFGFEWEKVE